MSSATIASLFRCPPLPSWKLTSISSRGIGDTSASKSTKNRKVSKKGACCGSLPTSLLLLLSPLSAPPWSLPSLPFNVQQPLPPIPSPSFLSLSPCLLPLLPKRTGSSLEARRRSSSLLGISSRGRRRRRRSNQQGTKPMQARREPKLRPRVK